jgi:hypothetical protein
VVVAGIYRLRWQIELFFRWIKGHLRIEHFSATVQCGEDANLDCGDDLLAGRHHPQATETARQLAQNFATFERPPF